MEAILDLEAYTKGVVLLVCSLVACDRLQQALKVSVHNEGHTFNVFELFELQDFLLLCTQLHFALIDLCTVYFVRLQFFFSPKIVEVVAITYKCFFDSEIIIACL